MASMSIPIAFEQPLNCSHDSTCRSAGPLRLSICSISRSTRMISCMLLHHTGEMWRALDHASRCVRPGGLLAAAIYRRSPACPFWRWEKRVYNRAYAPVRTAIRSAYKAIYLAAIAASGRNPLGYVMDYHRSRGMSFHHDIHDWLGGYPYESAAPAEIIGFLAERGFLIERSFQRPAALKGLFGSHCDEYVVRRKG
jgi:SAM-dependent methyltransferase